jgi:hypothetical protein
MHHVMWHFSPPVCLVSHLPLANYLIAPADEPATHNLSIFFFFTLISSIFAIISLVFWVIVARQGTQNIPQLKRGS